MAGSPVTPEDQPQRVGTGAGTADSEADSGAAPPVEYNFILSGPKEKTDIIERYMSKD